MQGSGGALLAAGDGLTELLLNSLESLILCLRIFATSRNCPYDIDRISIPL